MNNLLENIFAGKELYYRALAPVCEKYGLSHTEITILLFLANSPQDNTATDIVEQRRLTKSSVSVAARTLQEQGYISGEFTHGNHRSIHLKLCDKAKPVILDGRAAQRDFLSRITEGLTAQETEQLSVIFRKLSDNIYNMQKENK